MGQPCSPAIAVQCDLGRYYNNFGYENFDKAFHIIMLETLNQRETEEG
jgi:hypothetical protein